MAEAVLPRSILEFTDGKPGNKKLAPQLAAYVGASIGESFIWTSYFSATFG